MQPETKLLDFTLSFTDREWVCFNENTSFSVSEVQDLELQLYQHLQEHVSPGAYIVNLYFDFDRFPVFYRQYMSHYFNSKLHFVIK